MLLAFIPVLPVVGAVSLALFLAIVIPLALLFWVLPAILCFVLLSKVPAAHRRQEPALAFLLLIPLFSVIWAFFVYPRIADSIQSCLSAQGDDTVGDAGKGIANATCICWAVGLIPGLGLVANPVGFILMIVFFVKAFSFVERIAPQAA